MTVPSPGAAFSATNSGGGPTAGTVPAADYYLTAAGGVSGLLATLQALLQSSRPPVAGSWSVVLNMSTGRVVIDCPSGASITKTGGVNATWDAGVSSVQTIAGDGYVEAYAAETNKYRFLGLSATDSNVNYTSILYGLQLDGAATLNVYESGVNVAVGPSYAAGDRVSITRTGTTITYAKNGVVFYTSATPSTGTLRVDLSLFNTSATLHALKFYDVATPVAITWQNATNVTTGSQTYSITWTNTTLRDQLGFTADIVAVNAPQTGTKQARGLWIPGCTFDIAGDPRMAPKVTDLRSTESPTGVINSLRSTFKREHNRAHWSHVTIDHVREASAPYANGSWERFLDETQFGLGSSWFSVGSLIQIYDHNGDRLGSDANVAGWAIHDVDSFGDTASLVVDGYTGLWDIHLPRLVAVGG